MTIALVSGQNAGAVTSPGTSVTRAFPSNLTVGSLVVVAVSAFKGATNDPFAVSDIAQSAGTATLGPWSLDEQINENLSSGGSTYLNTAVYSAIVTGAGSCTAQITGIPNGYHWIAVAEFSGNWDAARRHTATARWNTQASATAPDTGAVSSVGAALFIAVAATYSGANPVTYTEDGAFTSLYASTNGAADHTGELAYRVVTDATTDSAAWTAPATHGWNALIIVYKEAGSTTKKVPPRRRFAQPQQATRIDWSNPITRGLELAINFGEASHDTCVNLVSGIRLTASVATAPDKGVGIHGKWQGRGNSDGNYWIPGETFPAVPRTVIAFMRDWSVTGNRCVIASFGDGSSADWIGFETLPQPVINLSSSNRGVGLGTYMANDSVYGYDIKVNDYRIYQRGRLAATDTSSAGTPALKNIGGLTSGFSTYASRMYMVASWARILTPEEHHQIAVNPWQIFMPMRGMFMLGAAGPSFKAAWAVGATQSCS